MVKTRRAAIAIYALLCLLCPSLQTEDRLAKAGRASIAISLLTPAS